jgi:hypothetical protein
MVGFVPLLSWVQLEGVPFVLLVGDGFSEGAGAAVLVDLLDGDVDHQAVGARAVPVVLAGLEEHAVGYAAAAERPVAARGGGVHLLGGANPFGLLARPPAARHGRTITLD